MHGTASSARRGIACLCFKFSCNFSWVASWEFEGGKQVVFNGLCLTQLWLLHHLHFTVHCIRDTSTTRSRRPTYRIGSDGDVVAGVGTCHRVRRSTFWVTQTCFRLPAQATNLQIGVRLKPPICRLWAANVASLAEVELLHPSIKECNYRICTGQTS
jgi:hypothetical protein